MKWSKQERYRLMCLNEATSEFNQPSLQSSSISSSVWHIQNNKYWMTTIKWKWTISLPSQTGGYVNVINSNEPIKNKNDQKLFMLMKRPKSISKVSCLQASKNPEINW